MSFNYLEDVGYSSVQSEGLEVAAKEVCMAATGELEDLTVEFAAQDYKPAAEKKDKKKKKMIPVRNTCVSVPYLSHCNQSDFSITGR